MKKPRIGIPIRPPTIETMTIIAIWLIVPADLEIINKTILMIRRAAESTTKPKNIIKYL
jgi:hypothetical protein